MSIELTIRANDAADLKVQLAALLGGAAILVATGGGGGGGGAADAPRTSTRKPAEPKAEPPKAEPEPAAEITQVSEEAIATVADDPAERGPLTYDGDIKPAVLKVSAKHGRPGVEKLLADFGVDHTSKVTEDKWPEFLAAIDKMLEG